MRSVLFLHYLVFASVIRVRFYSHPSLPCYTCFLHSVLGMVYRSASVLFVRNLFVVLLPKSMVRSFSTIFSIYPSFPIVSVEILLDIVLRREMISILLYCSVTSTFVSLQLSLRLVFFRFRRFRVAATFSFEEEFRFSFTCPVSGFFEFR